MQNNSNIPEAEIPYGYCHCGCGQLAPVAKKSDKSTNRIKGNPMRYIAGHRKGSGPIPKPIQELFWSKVTKTDSCWLWTGKKVGMGYGSFAHGKHHAVKHYRAHRLSYEWAYGSIPAGLNVLHDCDNPACVRPDHLKLGTHQDNMDDKVRKGRQAKGMNTSVYLYPEHRARGERSGQANLSDIKVLAIRAEYANGHSMSGIARQFAVSVGCINFVVKRKTWKHIS